MGLGERISDTREFVIEPRPPLPWVLIAALGVGILLVLKPKSPTIIVQGRR